jgi:hypothetical protein
MKSFPKNIIKGWFNAWGKDFADSQDLYQTMRHDKPEYILQRTAIINPDTLLFLRKKLQGSHCDWRYPGMIIRPAHSPWVEDLVALDPLYLVDTHADLITPVVSKFTPEYQRRLRRYVIDEYSDVPAFWNLPQRQFGFVYSMGYFNFKPWEIIKQYLSEIFELLRDGGTFLFSFNDCDQWRAVGSVEHHFCCYTPGRLIKEHAVALGFTIELDFNDEAGTSWLELRKPGIFETIRGGQNVAAISPREDMWKEPTVETIPPTKVDIPSNPVYNQVDMLLDISRMLEIDVTDATAKGAYSVKKLRRLISARLNSQSFPEEKIQRLLNKRNNI